MSLLSLKMSSRYFSALVGFLAIAGQVSAGVVSIPSGPLFVGASVTPLVMLDITKDQNLYKKAYDDYTDLKGDGWASMTYDHTIDYYGYFDSYKCYTYSSSTEYFSPVASSISLDANKKPVKPSDCLGSAWHGNFLNWVAMSRMDTVRKLLYGGLRSTDTTTETILERSFIPSDAHSWAKYYNPKLAKTLDTWPSHQSELDKHYPDINKLTPYKGLTTGEPTAVSSTTSVVLEGSQTAPKAKVFNVGSSVSQFAYGDQVLIESAADAKKYMIGVVSCVNGTGINMFNDLATKSNECSANEIKVVVENSVGTGTIANWNIYDMSQTGISACNTTPDSGVVSSQTSTAAPMMRVARGNFSLWAANERWQCYWREESSGTGALAGHSESLSALTGSTSAQGNRAALSGIWASAISPNKTTAANGRVINGLTDSAGLGPDYKVRVKVCDASAFGNEKCAEYPSKNYKPIGLLQYFGESGRLKFGLMTGTYTKNKSGGVLRKNISNIADEIEAATDGTFKTTMPTTGSIIRTLDKMRVWGYNYGSGGGSGGAAGTYNKDGVNSDTFCEWSQTTITEGNCLSWGNPMSEVYLESVRYLAGKKATTAFDVTSDVLGLPSPTWDDPLSSKNYCAPLNVLVFNSASNTYENDGQMGGASDIGTAAAKCDATTWTDKIGGKENISGKKWFVGNDGNGSKPTDLCSSKELAKFSDAFGLCPEGAGTEGTYKMTGVAYFSHTSDIREASALSVPTNMSTENRNKILKVDTYGIALASNTPKVTVTVNKYPVTIMPQGRLDKGTGGSGTVVDWKIACVIPDGATAATIATIAKASAGRCASAGTGAFYWNHEDSEQGGDYDQDMWGRVQYSVTSDKIAVTTDVMGSSTGADPFGFGYAISGTSNDGPHFHSGINSFKFPLDPNPAPVTGGGASISSNTCSACDVGSSSTTATYTVSSTATDTVLRDPLWYAAKYGSFKDDPKSPTKEPGDSTRWDLLNNTTGLAGKDGVPDNFYLVTNPSKLEESLYRSFDAMSEKSSASAVATNSTSIQSDALIYQARFNASDWTGSLLAFALSSVDDPAKGIKIGDVAKTETWNAATVLKNQTSRNIITMGVDSSPKQAIPFTWSALSGQTAKTQVDALNSNGLGTADASANLRGSDRLDYLRGSSTNEGDSATKFRIRKTPLGDIVNSGPVYVAAPDSGWAGGKYKLFRTTYGSRIPIVYVGANDGMLHAFQVLDQKDANGKVVSAAGTELLGYIPSVFYNNQSLQSNLSQLANQSYGHRFFVDGTPMVNDIEVGAANDWKTVLVGGLNWGGRAFYALDITDPAGVKDADRATGAKLAFSEANAKNLAMWEFTSANDSDLGYSFVQPTYPAFKGTAQQILKMRNGKWAAIVGNGYNSTDGKAALFIFFLDRTKDSNGVYSSTWTLGTDYIKLVADMQVPGNFNGLSTPIPFSAIGDGIVDWVYAGDLNGNVWKFDVSSATTADWKVAFNTGSCDSITNKSTCTPLFIAKDSAGTRQSITTAPLVMRHPNGGAMVLFGTGKYLETTDTATTGTQTYYGVWDNGKNDASNTDRTKLLQQKVAGTKGYPPNDYRITTDYCIVAGSMSKTDIANTNATMLACNDDWSSSLAKKGWFMDLPLSGERLAYNALLRNDRIVFPTLIPSTIPCEPGGSSWVMELDALTGRVLTESPFDINLDGNFDATDNTALVFNDITRIAGGIKPGEGGIFTTPTVIKDPKDPKKEFKYASTSGGAVVKTPESVSQNQAGRISWREIVQ